MPACFITQAEKRIIMSYSVAIDGPAGAGKSTIAKLISKQMGYNICRYRCYVTGQIGGIF